MIRVLLADDHAVVRTGFRLLLETQADLCVVGEADSGEAACASYSQLLPDVLLLDLAMPGMGGHEALRRIRAHHPQARVLALSAHDDLANARRILRAGASGFVGKRSAPQTLIEAVRTVAAGGRHVDAELAQRLALDDAADCATSPLTLLSAREIEVLVRLARGETVQRIAADLTLSASTVGSHLYNIKQKLAVSTQAELTRLAIRHRLIEA